MIMNRSLRFWLTWGEKKYQKKLAQRSLHPMSNSLIDVKTETRLLMAHILGVDKLDLLIMPQDKKLNLWQIIRYQKLLRARIKGSPYAYLVGHKEFMSLVFLVNRHVLIPRDLSEELVIAVLAHLPQKNKSYRMLELGTGSGCLLLSLLHYYPNAKGVGIDLSSKALKLAQKNAITLGVADRVKLLKADMRQIETVVTIKKYFSRYDVLICNPPYISDKDWQVVKNHLSAEPMLALRGGTHGMDFYPCICELAKKLLKPKAILALEHAPEQTILIKNLFENSGFQLITKSVKKFM